MSDYTRKSVFLFILVLIAVSLLPAQIREYICVVRPVYSEQTLSMMESLSGQVAQAGYQSLSEFIKKGGNQIFGSGFVANAPDGSVVVITNHHVVLDAESAILQFEAADGSITEYKNCLIIAIDDELDLAMIRLPSDFPLKKGLTVSSVGIRDGSDAWSAGYPGLSGEPVWQLGKGTVTNATARIPRLVDPQVTTLLQHSAPVDSGNSGGPLLMENRTGTAGYDVVGVNTWKNFYRQATNFATPAQAISSFIQRGLASGTDATAEDLLKKRTTSFAQVTAIRNTDDRNERIRKMSRYLSLAYVNEYAPDSLLKVLSSAPTVVRNEVLETLSGSATLAGLRLASAWQFDIGLQALGDVIELGEPGNIPSIGIDGLTNVIFPVTGKDPVSVSWIREKSYWQIKSASFDRASPNTIASEDSRRTGSDVKKSGSGTTVFSLEQPFTIMLFAERTLDLDHSIYGTGALVSLAKFFAFGALFAVREVEYEERDFYGDVTEMTAKVQGPGVIVRGQIPVAVSKIIIVPYIEGRTGMAMPEGLVEEINTGSYNTLGVGAQFIFGDIFKFCISPSWQRYTGPDKKEIDSIVISAGIGL